MTAATVNKAVQDKLTALTGHEGIVGCMLVSSQGNSLYSTLPSEIDPTRLASIAATLYSNNDVSIQRMNRGNLTQMTLLTDKGLLHLYPINNHLLVVLTDPAQKIELENFLKAVEDGCSQLGHLLSGS